MVLVNAIYFHGGWEQPFSHDSTYEGNFLKNGNEQTKVNMMTIEKNFSYLNSSELDSKILGMNYKVCKLSYLIYK